MQVAARIPCTTMTDKDADNVREGKHERMQSRKSVLIPPSEKWQEECSLFSVYKDISTWIYNKCQ